MIKELYKVTVNETELNISLSKIDAVMKKVITKSGCRVYKDGYIGIAGTLGAATPDTWAEAEANLDKKIPYPFKSEKNKRRIRDLRILQMDDVEFIKEMEALLKELNKEFPEFIYSHKITLKETEFALNNDAGLDYINYDKTIEIVILAKHKDSIHLMDTAVFRVGREYNKEEILREARELLGSFTKEVPLPEVDRLPVIMDDQMLIRKLIDSLHGEAVKVGTSLFYDKFDKKIFNDNFTLIQNHSDDQFHRAFFDMEGVVNPNDQVKLIEDGCIKSSFTDKKTATKYSLPATGSASGEYDDAPQLRIANLSMPSGNKNLKELLNGELGIFVLMASGGDYTDDGNFASPVQIAYLTDGEHLLGKLPEFTITSNIFKQYGEDFIGVSSDKRFTGYPSLVIRMKVN